MKPAPGAWTFSMREERVGVCVVDVRVDRPIPGVAHELEHLELVALVLDVELALRGGQRLALSGA
jgi:hypothetical protein